MEKLVNKLFILSVTMQCSYSTPIFARSGSEVVEATDFLQKFGYLPRGNNQLSSRSLTIALKQMQKMAGLEETGELDDRTQQMMNRPRCGMPDVQTKYLDTNALARKRRSTDRLKWKEKIITYGCKKPAQSTRIHYDDIRRVMRQAAAQWSQLADVELIETNDEKPMIQISSGNPRHSPCPVPLESTTLAHAFFPPNGQIHINDNVHFSMNNFTENYNDNSLYAVVAHELGHALGFEHSPDTKSVMYAYDIPRKWIFTQNDRYQMEMYYGTKKRSNVNNDPKKNEHQIPKNPHLGDEIIIKTEKENNNIQPNECNVKKPIIVFYRDEFFVFKNSWVWRISSDWKNLIMKPTLIEKFFQGLPSPIDAAVEVQGHLWAFVGNKVYVINGNRILHAPLSLRDLGISETSVDLAYEWNYFYPPAVYIWKKDKYWKLDEKMGYRRVDERYPKQIDLNWGKVPLEVHSAFTFEREIHFVRGNTVYRMNSSRSHLDIADGFPRSIESYFLFCPQAESLVLRSSSMNNLMISFLLSFTFSIFIIFH